MKFNYNKLTIFFFFLIYFGLYLLSHLANYFIPINIIEIILFLLISISCFTGIYITNYYKISQKTKGNIQIIIVIILSIFMFFNPLKFSNYYNFYINKYLAVIIIIFYLTLLLIIGKKLNIDYWLPIIILIPYLIQAILINIFNMINLYISFPYINLILTITGFIVYKNFIKK